MIAAAVSFVAFHLATPDVANAQSCIATSANPSYFEGPIGLVFTEPELEKVVLEAIDHWSSCANYGVGFPSFVFGADASSVLRTLGASRTVEIVLERGAGEQGKCAGFRARTIRLFRRAVTQRGELLSCGSLARNLAHELGHVLGLRDARPGKGCRSRMMAAVSASLSKERIVSAEECSLAGAHAIGRHELEALMLALGGRGQPSAAGGAVSGVARAAGGEPE